MKTEDGGIELASLIVESADEVVDSIPVEALLPRRPTDVRKWTFLVTAGLIVFVILLGMTGIKTREGDKIASLNTPVQTTIAPTQAVPPTIPPTLPVPTPTPTISPTSPESSMTVSWGGVTLDESTQKILLTKPILKGPIPTEIGLLTQLTELVVQFMSQNIEMFRQSIHNN